MVLIVSIRTHLISIKICMSQNFYTKQTTKSLSMTSTHGTLSPLIIYFFLLHLRSFTLGRLSTLPLRVLLTLQIRLSTESRISQISGLILSVFWGPVTDSFCLFVLRLYNRLRYVTALPSKYQENLTDPDLITYMWFFNKFFVSVKYWNINCF